MLVADRKEGGGVLTKPGVQMFDPIRFHKHRDGVPSIAHPHPGEPLTIALSYANRARAERQASAWNALQPTHGLAVRVGPRDPDGQWPLIWAEVTR